MSSLIVHCVFMNYALLIFQEKILTFAVWIGYAVMLVTNHLREKPNISGSQIRNIYYFLT